MTDTLRVVLIIVLFIYFYMVIALLKSRKLALKYSLLWLVMGIVMCVLVIFPRLLNFLCDLIGIAGTMNGLFTFAIAFILILLMAVTSIVSKQSDKIKNLIQDNALLEKRIRELEKEREK